MVVTHIGTAFALHHIVYSLHINSQQFLLTFVTMWHSCSTNLSQSQILNLCRSESANKALHTSPQHPLNNSSSSHHIIKQDATNTCTRSISLCMTLTAALATCQQPDLNITTWHHPQNQSTPIVFSYVINTTLLLLLLLLILPFYSPLDFVRYYPGELEPER